MASRTKLGVWRRTGVRVQRTGRRTHRVHPAKSIVMKSWREARAGIFGRGRENLRDTAHRQYRGTYERLAAQAEGGAERHQASARAPLRRCPPSCTHTTRPSDARSAAAPPRAPPYGRGKASRRRTGAPAGRPTPRCGGSSRTSPTLAPRLPAPTPRPVGTHRRPPSRRTGRSYRSLPLQRGAPQRHHRRPSPVISPAIAGRSRHRVSPLVIERGKILNGGVLIERGTQPEVP